MLDGLRGWQWYAVGGGRKFGFLATESFKIWLLRQEEGPKAHGYCFLENQAAKSTCMMAGWLVVVIVLCRPWKPYSVGAKTLCRVEDHVLLSTSRQSLFNFFFFRRCGYLGASSLWVFVFVFVVSCLDVSL